MIRKRVESRFGVIKYRWRVLGSESELWDVTDVVVVPEVCVILHNMLIRMEQVGAFVEDTAAEDE